MSWHRRNPTHFPIVCADQFPWGSFPNPLLVFFGSTPEYLDLSCCFCYNLLWVIVHKTEQNLKRTVVKIEHFTAVFLYPKERNEVSEMANRNRTNPVQFYLAMMSSTSSTPNSKHPAWRVCLLSCASRSYMEMCMMSIIVICEIIIRNWDVSVPI